MTTEEKLRTLVGLVEKLADRVEHTKECDTGSVYAEHYGCNCGLDTLRMDLRDLVQEVRS